MENSVWKLIQDLSSKKGITEIIINNPNVVFVEREGKLIQLNAELTKDDIYEFIQKMATFNKKKCNKDFPILDGSLPDGSRINAIIEPFVMGCPAITIRKYLKHIKSFDNSPQIFGLDPYWVTFFKAAVAAKCNIIVSGGTGVGKTTFLNLLINECDDADRIVSIEDTIELNIEKANVVRMEAGIKLEDSSVHMTIRDLVKNTLRMRPDRIIIGETRGGEVFDLLQAMNTGHDGSMSSIHANTTGDCVKRIEGLFLLAGFNVPLLSVRQQLSSAVDFIIQIGRNRKGNRMVSKISEITGIDGESLLMSTIAENTGDGLKFSGVPPSCLQKLTDSGIVDRGFFS